MMKKARDRYLRYHSGNSVNNKADAGADDAAVSSEEIEDKGTFFVTSIVKGLLANILTPQAQRTPVTQDVNTLIGRVQQKGGLGEVLDDDFVADVTVTAAKAALPLLSMLLKTGGKSLLAVVGAPTMSHHGHGTHSSRWRMGARMIWDQTRADMFPISEGMHTGDKSPLQAQLEAALLTKFKNAMSDPETYESEPTWDDDSPVVKVVEQAAKESGVKQIIEKGIETGKIPPPPPAPSVAPKTMQGKAPLVELTPTGKLKPVAAPETVIERVAPAIAKPSGGMADVLLSMAGNALRMFAVDVSQQAIDKAVGNQRPLANQLSGAMRNIIDQQMMPASGERVQGTEKIRAELEQQLRNSNDVISAMLVRLAANPKLPEWLEATWKITLDLKLPEWKDATWKTPMDIKAKPTAGKANPVVPKEFKLVKSKKLGVAETSGPGTILYLDRMPTAANAHSGTPMEFKITKNKDGGAVMSFGRMPTMANASKMGASSGLSEDTVRKACKMFGVSEETIQKAVKCVSDGQKCVVMLNNDLLRNGEPAEQVYEFMDKVESGVHFYENGGSILRFTPSVFTAALNPRNPQDVSVLCTLSSDKWTDLYILRANA